MPEIKKCICKIDKYAVEDCYVHKQKEREMRGAMAQMRSNAAT